MEKICNRCRRICFSQEQYETHPCFDMDDILNAEIALANGTLDGHSFSAWRTYDSCAEWCAKRGLQGKDGDPLPQNISGEVQEMINADVEAFQQRVRDTAYALSMKGLLP